MRNYGMSMMDRLLNSPDFEKMSNNKDIPGLIRLLSSRHHEIHAAAISALGRIGPDATPFLIAALKRKNRLLRLGVIGALAEIQDPRSLAALIERTRDESNEIR